MVMVKEKSFTSFRAMPDFFQKPNFFLDVADDLIAMLTETVMGRAWLFAPGLKAHHMVCQQGDPGQ